MQRSYNSLFRVSVCDPILHASAYHYFTTASNSWRRKFCRESASWRSRCCKRSRRLGGRSSFFQECVQRRGECGGRRISTDDGLRVGIVDDRKGQRRKIERGLDALLCLKIHVDVLEIGKCTDEFVDILNGPLRR